VNAVAPTAYFSLRSLFRCSVKQSLTSGKLDNVIAQAEADIAANNVRDLDEVFRNA
jgi:hypothetical protein